MYYKPPKGYINNHERDLSDAITKRIDSEIITEMIPELLKETVDLKKKIKLKIKYFVEDHKLIEIEVLNGDILSEVLKEIMKKEIFLKYQIKKVYFVDNKNLKKVVLVNKEEKIHELGLADDNQLILLLNRQISFDANNITSGFKLHNNNTRIRLTKENLKDGLVFEMAFFDLTIISGRFYWQILVNHIIQPENFLIGLAKPNINKTQNPFDSGCFWGVQPLM
jgi:hypothetical protein